MTPSRSIHVFALAFLIAGTAYAQSGEAAKPAPPAAQATAAIPDGGPPEYIKPETVEQRRARLGTAEDPGTDPSGEIVFHRYGKNYKIERFERRWANYDGVAPGWVKPFGFVNATMELYQQNADYVWVWVEQAVDTPMTEEQAAAADFDDTKYVRYNDDEINYFQQMRSEFTVLDVPASGRVVRFENSSEGLPQSGSWRNTIAIADMNSDKKPDIIVPAERGVNGVPAIFLGDGKGKWRFWKEAQWPYTLSYGSVAVGDLNRDGAMDVAYGVHLGGLRVFLGNGKGKFVDASEGLPRDWGTRRVSVIDIDVDGDMDIVAVNEGPSVGVEKREEAKLMTFINDGTGRSWTRVNVAAVEAKLGGDWLALGNFNGDKYPDVMGASVYFNGTDLLYMSSGQKKWTVFGGMGKPIPFLSYHFGMTAGRFGGSTGKLDDVIASYARTWPENIHPRTIPEPPLTQTVGFDRISFKGKEATRTPIVRWGGSRGILGMTAGDFDRDGNLDLAYTRHDPRELGLLLGDGRGGFTRAMVEGVQLAPNSNYDLVAADVNGDGRRDLVVMYESAGSSRFASRDGAIQVYLNRGSGPASAVK